MKEVTLIGMPGAGKSTIGKMLAKQIGFQFIDLDILIKEKENRGHADILEKDGEQKLLQLENDYTLGLDLTKTVFSPGGSIIYSPEAMAKLQNETAIVYLKLPLGELQKRIGKGMRERGIVGLKEKSFGGLFNERTPLYQSFAHHAISCFALTDQSIVNKIINLIQ